MISPNEEEEDTFTLKLVSPQVGKVSMEGDENSREIEINNSAQYLEALRVCMFAELLKYTQQMQSLTRWSKLNISSPNVSNGLQGGNNVSLLEVHEGEIIRTLTDGKLNDHVFVLGSYYPSSGSESVASLFYGIREANGLFPQDLNTAAVEMIQDHYHSAWLFITNSGKIFPACPTYNPDPNGGEDIRKWDDTRLFSEEGVYAGIQMLFRLA